MRTIQSNEDRADRGAAAFKAYVETESFPKDDDAIEANREDWASDIIADLGHYFERHGLDARERIFHGLESYEMDRDPGELGGFEPVAKVEASI